ncbi:UNVERIFIED_ORG: hypothetical protein FHR35_001058 [Microbispora rosea subsp. rosea]
MEHCRGGGLRGRSLVAYPERAPGEEVEFWQADRDRRHTRLRYTREEAGWARHRLWP